MKSALLHEENGQKTYVLIFSIGEEVLEGMQKFADDFDLGAGQFTAVGALSDLVVGYFNWEKKDYNKIPINEQVEVLMLAGDITRGNGKPRIHAHIVVSKQDATAHGGHLLEAHVRPTLEMIVQESPGHLVRRYDEQSHISVISI